MSIPLLRKRWNHNLVEYQKRRGDTLLLGHPVWLTVDPSSVCNLQCVFCPTGQRRGTRASCIMPFDRFRRIMDALGPYLLHIDFCNWGEPLLNPELPEMIAYAVRFGARTKIDTNLSNPLTPAFARALVRSGVDRITLSVDGATQAAYGTYRRGGDLSLVLANMRLLVAEKRAAGTETPHLHWQFLVFRHNEHERAAAEALAREIGVDSIGFTAPFCGPEWVSTIDEYNNYRTPATGERTFRHVDRTCGWLWDAITINADGSVSPCCSVEEQKDDFGNFFAQPFPLLWNNAAYRAARRWVMTRRAGDRSTVCTRCDHIGASDHAPVVRP